MLQWRVVTTLIQLCFVFVSRTFFPLLSAALTVLLGSLQAHDGHERQKSRAQECLGRWGDSTGKGGSAEASAKSSLQLENWCQRFRNLMWLHREGWLRRVMAAWVNVADQCAVRAAATLCWRMVRQLCSRAISMLMLAVCNRRTR